MNCRNELSIFISQNLFFFFLVMILCNNHLPGREGNNFVKELGKPYIILISTLCLVLVFSPVFSLYFLWHTHQARGNGANVELSPASNYLCAGLLPPDRHCFESPLSSQCWALFQFTVFCCLNYLL